MPTVEKILERRREVSSQVSAQTRTLALGMLAISWALLTAHDDPLKTMVSHANHLAVLGLAALAAAVLACDLLQYVAYTRVADKALREAEASETGKAPYDADSFVYKSATVLYFGKFALLACSVALLVWVFLGLATSGLTS